MAKRSSAFVPVIPLDRSSPQPLHAQIYRALRDEISRGSLKAGQRVPSSRIMSTELSVSRITVLDAYSQLRAEGYFRSAEGRRHLHQPVSPPSTSRRSSRSSLPNPRMPPAHARSLAALCWRRLNQRPLGSPASAPSQSISPRLTSSPSPSGRASSPTTPATRTRMPSIALNPLGSRRFREAVCDYLRTARAPSTLLRTKVMIVSGSQQALQIAAAVLLDPGAAVWMEEPGYRLARNVFLAAGCRLVPVPVDAEGLNVTTGIKRSPNAAAAYVTPSHQYPLGSTMSAARRLQLLNWAQRSGSWIIEDDYDSEYRFESAPISSLQGLDTNARVLYIGTFSKVLFASLRMGYMVIPQDLVERFAAVRYAMDIFPPYLYQEVITDFIQAGHFSRHIRRMRLLYSQRRKTLVDLLRTQLGSILEIHGSEAGMHLAATFRAGFDRDDVTLAERAAVQKLWLWPLSKSYVTKDMRRGFILGYGNVAPQTMPKAVAKLKSLLTRP